MTLLLFPTDGRLISETDGATGEALRDYVWLGLMPIAVIDATEDAPGIETYDTEGNIVRRFEEKEYRRQGNIYMACNFRRQSLKNMFSSKPLLNLSGRVTQLLKHQPACKM